MSFNNKPNREDSPDTRKLRAEYEKKAQEFRESHDKASKAKLRDDKERLFQRVVSQMKAERRESTAEAHKVLGRLGRFKTDEQLKAERDKANSQSAKRIAQESRA